ncbi:MAG: diaminopimelate epimerase [Synergistetes bacterium]|nr:diaminopimelate epimerase [Synergistota bacterium]MDW8192884.1 diaminopimelate epimerase [Synergistota bacterium]
MEIPFYKMNGAGNDFIVIDNRDGVMNGVNVTEFVALVCRRRKSIGADGLMLLERSNIADFKMRYFNSDGSEGEMCGNGARCIAKFAYLLGVSGRDMRFETLSGVCEAKIVGDDVRVKLFDLSLKDVWLGKSHDFGFGKIEFHFAQVGVPHAVIYKGEVDSMSYEELISMARKIRYAFDIFHKGTNVNFVKVLSSNGITVRTYERGVEDETWACGTGSVASSLVSSLLFGMSPPISVKVKGGLLKVDFRLEGDLVRDVCLEGDARVVAKGYIMPDALRED